MARNPADAIAAYGAALQLDRGRWIWLLLIVLTLSVLLALGGEVTASLRYERAAIGAGAWWRLLSAHVVHLDAHHLALNGLGLVLIWALFAGDYDPLEWCLIVLSGALAISSGLWWLSPRVEWYVGCSGLLHVATAAGAAKHLLRRDWDRWWLLAGLGLKLLYEQQGGREPPLVVVDAHLYGAIAGFALGLLLTRLRSARVPL